MEDSLNATEGEDSLSIATKDWNRVTNAAKKTGYREGVQNGSDSVFQEGFDKGYEEAFKTAFMLGKFKSLLNAMPKDIKHPPHIMEVLDKTRRGACHICMTKPHNSTENMQEPISQIIDEQRTHSHKTLQMLYQYFEPYVEQLNINESNLLEIQNYVQATSKHN